MWVAALAGLAISGCAQPPVRTAARHGKEYFPEGKYGVASPRVVLDGQPVPRGGGQYLVGHPYTIAGRTYYPSENPNYSAVGFASWYGDAFHGRRTANGEVYDMRSLSAAHPTMPLPSYARVTNLSNGYSVIVRVNDRGPYHSNRVMDVSSRVADVLDFKGAGSAKIRVDYVGRAPLEGSDDGELLASLRTDGSPASIDGSPASAPVMVAEQERPAPPPPLVRLIAPAPPPSAPREETELAESAAPRIARPPMPPPRPLDLGERSASVFKVAAAPLPPRSAARLSSSERALYFSSAENPWREPRASDPFALLLERADAAPLSARDR
jgi:rare lipoprotein A